MKSEEVQVGMKVKVRDRQKIGERRGTVGRVVGCYGGEEYLAVDVRFPDGRHQLLWSEDLDQEGPSSRSLWRFLLGGVRLQRPR